MGLIQSKFKNFSIFFLIPLILSIGLVSSVSFFDFIQEAEGVPAEGTSSEKSFGSKTAGIVCGDRLCSEVEPTRQESSSTPLPKVTEEGIQEINALRIGDAMVEIQAVPGGAGEKMLIKINFVDLAGNDLEDVNFNIKATQNGKVILNKQGEYDADGEKTFNTNALVAASSIDDPVDIQIEFLGIGIDEIFSNSGEVPNDSPRFLEIKGDPVTSGSAYQIVVTGQILHGPNANPSDTLSPDGTTIDGYLLSTGLDDYSFTGNIVSITADQHVFSFVDGVEVVTTQVVPEFGTIAIMILGFAIISIITVTARSKVIPRL